MKYPIGDVIWSAVKPIIKIYLILLTGFLLAKKNILTVETTRSLSDMVLTVFLPCLTFNKVVANIQGSDIKDVGVICLSAVIIFGTGALCSAIVKAVSPVPKRWTGGLFAGGIFPNISDIPIAYLQTMDSGFLLTEAQGEKGVSHVIIFLAMFTLCLFNIGGFRLIEYDFRKVDDEEQLKRQISNPINPVPLDKIQTQGSMQSTNNLDTVLEEADEDETPKEELPGDETNTPPLSESDQSDSSTENSELAQEDQMPVPLTEDMMRRRRNSTSSRRSDLSQLTASSTASSLRSFHRVSDLRRMPSQTINDVVDEYSEADVDRQDETQRQRLVRVLTSEVGVKASDIKDSSPSFLKKYHLSIVSFFLQNCLRPCSLAIIISLIVAFVPWLKALFVKTTVYMPSAPDTLPPLNFIMDYTSYIGAASVPLALILLGGCIARLKFDNLAPGFWRSALILVVLRLCVMPILGVLWVNRLVSSGWISKDDITLKLVICMSWGLPSMTTQIYFTAFLTEPDAPDKVQLDCTSFYLLLQYPLLVISLPFVVTYVVENMF